MKLLPVLLQMLHIKSRCEIYPRTNGKVRRVAVPDDKVPWEVDWDYNPPEFTADRVKGKEWADPELGAFQPAWNSLDGKVDRRSYEGKYKIVGGVPRNVLGRTGLGGRGVLGRWGPNHAADPVVTTWKRDGGVVLHPVSGRPILQFVAIRRRDNGEWALPGGMVDPGEAVPSTLRREFFEEALAALDMDRTKRANTQRLFAEFFAGGEQVYRGYVDDPRNTDNAWIETLGWHFHDESGDVAAALPLQAGDDAVSVRWTDASADLPLYASHSTIIQAVVTKLGAHWHPTPS